MRITAILAAAAAVALGLIGVGPGPAASAATATGWTASSVPLEGLPSGAAKSSVVLAALSCPVAGWCGAVGMYRNSHSAEDGFLETISSYQSLTPLPTLNLGGPGARFVNRVAFTRIFCPKQGFCVAVGSYSDEIGYGHGLIATLADGRWSAIPAPLSGIAPSMGELPSNASLSDVSCTTSGTCVAVGRYDSWEHGLIESYANGVWTPSAAPLPPAGSGYSDLVSVSCAGPDSCTAIGSYADANAHDGLIETLSGGTWSPSALPTTGLNPPPHHTYGNGVVPTRIDCPTSTMCAAVGSYEVADSDVGFVATRSTTGTWEVGTAPTTSTSTAGFRDLSCPDAGWCAAAAYAPTGGASALDTLSGGSWTAAAVPGTGTADQSDWLSSISCAQIGSCTAAGFNFTDGQALIDTLNQGTWSAATAPVTGLSPAPATTPDALLYTVSCPAVGACTAGGHYSTGNSQFAMVEQQYSGGPPLYVAAGGADTGNNCTDATSPCASVSHALSLAVTGETVYAAGTIADNVTVGNASGTLTLTQWPNSAPAVLDGGGATVLTVGSGDTLNVHGLTIQDAGTSPGVEVSGGAVYLDSATVTTSGRGVDLADAQSTATITTSYLSGNAVGAYSAGGALDLTGTTVDRSTGYGVYSSGGATTVADSTISGTAGTAAVGVNGGTTNLLDDTITGSTGDAVDVAGGALALTSVTVAHNGSGIAASAGTTTLAASILAGNNGPSCTGGGFSSAGYNLTDDTSSTPCALTAATDVIGTDPDLGPLQDNGGPTQTMLPAVTGPAANRIPPGTALAGLEVCGVGAFDQIGAARPQPRSASECSTGATEVDLISPVIMTAPSAFFIVGRPGQFPITATGSPAPSLGLSGTLPKGITFDPSTGLLSGTPQLGAGGDYSVQIGASNGVAPDAVRRLDVSVAEAPSFTSAPAATFTVGSYGSFSVKALGYGSPSLSEAGALPRGVSFSSGQISGTPEAGTAGRYPITISASNFVATVTQSFVLTVNPINCQTARGAALPGAVGIAAVEVYGCPGYYVVDSTGQVAAFGSATYHGGVNSPTAGMVGMVAKPDGSGYWVVSATGAVHAFGSAGYFGGADRVHLAAPIEAMAVTQDGRGYWLFARDGGIFSYGDATFYGSMGGQYLAQPVDGMAVAPGGNGYWLVASDGGVFTFTPDGFYGSMGGHHLDKPVIGMAGTPDGKGYTLVGSDGGVFNFGDSRFYGSLGGSRLLHPIIDLSPAPSGDGYYLVDGTGAVFAFGPGTRYFGGA